MEAHGHPDLMLSSIVLRGHDICPSHRRPMAHPGGCLPVNDQNGKITQDLVERPYGGGEIAKTMPSDKLIHGQRPVKGQRAYTCPFQCSQMPTDTQGAADVRTQRSDIGALGAHHPHRHIPVRDVEYIQFMDDNRPGLPSNRFPGTSGAVERHTIDFHRRVHRWYLLNFASKPADDLPDCFRCEMT